MRIKLWGANLFGGGSPRLPWRVASEAKSISAPQARLDLQQGQRTENGGGCISGGETEGSIVRKRGSRRQSVAVVGHSHINCIAEAGKRLGKACPFDLSFIQLRNAKYGTDPSAPFASPILEECNRKAVQEDLSAVTKNVSLTVLCLNGNEHYTISLANNPSMTSDRMCDALADSMVSFRNWLDFLCRYVTSGIVLIPPPPPVESADVILKNSPRFSEILSQSGVAPSEYRLKAYRHQIGLIKEEARKRGLVFLQLPAEVANERGFRPEEFFGRNSAHANGAYGEALLRCVSAFMAEDERLRARQGPQQAVSEPERRAAAEARRAAMQHPYTGLADWAYWKQGVAEVPLQAFDPVVAVPFKISPTDRVATAGSCFAQHISKRLSSIGFQFLVTELGPAATGGDDARGGPDFSARYGNIYTARQLLQLFERAYQFFDPIDNHWYLRNQRFCDPFRPRIEADGFSTVAALSEDREHHLAAVREMFERLDVLVFTLGLTECWISKLDGAAYPLAPGVAGGAFDPARYQFVNFGVDEVVRDLESFLKKLRLVNSGAKLILTVSPVPLMATYAPNHVLVSTTYSKSVLRVAAETVSRSCDGVYYFPSFEIIAGNYNRGRYFGPDLRTVTEEGVDHVMSIFMRHLTEAGTAASGSRDMSKAGERDVATAELRALAEAECDEELLGRD